MLDLVVSVPYLMVVVLLVTGVALTPVVLVGLPLVALGLGLAAVLGPLERARLRPSPGFGTAPRARSRPDAGRWRRLLLDSRPWWAACTCW